ncbi:jacalin-like lectin [Chitinophaga nivalis]|uniref:Glycosyl hydrolase family 18 protein n=1 Tax=Chitinophaga nivalis TaxID=2991709 RepID=A0ABT3IJQ8_9BACT|nr:glycosyl hydrolase family 18 protein [Chitinophaga nivalis]MCW3466112.1 glycosyl hydrolase family 18 protein [Chitinophaga nivalis]MCW3484197.1 glycosyl hydrolase family 18 protein [Chitinophaga nivalis]
MATPLIPSKSVNAWIYLDEDEPKGTGYTTVNSSYQSLVNNNVYKNTDMVLICFFAVIPDNQGYYTIDIGNATTVHPDGSTTAQYLQYTIQDARAQNADVKLLATLNYNTDNLSQIFSSNPDQWPTATANFATNVKNYLVANQMNGLDIDWEGSFASAITRQQFSMLFTAIRQAFDTNTSSYLYLSFSPAEVGNLDVATMNSCFDIVNLQLYSGFTYVSSFVNIGINPLLMAYGAKFESNYQNATNAYDQAQQGFKYQNQSYVYNNITQWRLNSDNYEFEQGQQILLYQLAYGVPGSSFNDGAIAGKAGNPPITTLAVSGGDVLDSLQATNSWVSNGTENILGLLQHGGNGGNGNTIQLSSGELITEVYGYTGIWFGWEVVAQLSVKTSAGHTYGPFGHLNNVSATTSFSYTAPSGQSIIAFNGNTSQVPLASGGTTMVITALNVSFG